MCKVCEHPKYIVLPCKFATIGGFDIGDACLECIAMMAEAEISMEKYDALGIGYTEEVLRTGALSLMLCGHCNKYRAETIMKHEGYMCPSCFQVLLYISLKRD